MALIADPFREFGSQTGEEGVARVVATDGRLVWLEPETKSACGGCISASMCGETAGRNRLEARRFSLVNDHGLDVGDRVVVGVPDGAVLRASATAYLLPLLTMLAGGIAGQQAIGSDLAAMAGVAAGLVVGLVAGRLVAWRLAARGDLTPQFVRLAEGDDGVCHSDGR